MDWYVYLAHFFGGAFLANAVPHTIMGVTGRRFPTAFSRPPGSGVSSPLVNVVWGTLNLLAAWVLIFLVEAPEPRPDADYIVIAVGAFLTALSLAVFFGRFQERRSG